MKKKFRAVLAVMLATMLSLSFAPMAFADPVDPEAISEAAITKVLKVPTGTDVPTGNFTFSVTPVSINSDTTLTPPAISGGTVTIAFPAGTYTHTETIGDVDIYYLESAELFSSITWPDTGIYEYLIVEDDATFTALTTAESMTYSQAEYTVRVHVREYVTGDIIPPGKNIGELYIFAIGAERTTEEDGTAGTDKVDPTPGASSTDYDYSQMTFTNIYTKHNGGTGDDPTEDTLTVSKAVVGAYASTTNYFEYNMTITKPSLVPGTAVMYKAYVIDSDGITVVSNLTPNGLTSAGSDGGGTFATFASGAATTFKLKAGQSLVFTNAHVGANYTIAETGVAGYIASALVLSDNISLGTVAGLVDASVTIPDGTTIATNPLIGEDTNSVAFTNTNDGITETGLDINNLPFIGLIALAVIGLGVFVVVKSRKRRTEEQ